MTTYQIEQYVFATPTSITLLETFEPFSTLAEAREAAREMAERTADALHVGADDEHFEVIQSIDGMTFFVDNANGESVHKFVVIEKYDEVDNVQELLAQIAANQTAIIEALDKIVKYLNASA